MKGTRKTNFVPTSAQPAHMLGFILDTPYPERYLWSINSVNPNMGAMCYMRPNSLHRGPSLGNEVCEMGNSSLYGTLTGLNIGSSLVPMSAAPTQPSATMATGTRAAE